MGVMSFTMGYNVCTYFVDQLLETEKITFFIQWQQVGPKVLLKKIVSRKLFWLSAGVSVCFNLEKTNTEFWLGSMNLLINSEY